jgi:hypothetical protein
MSYNEGGEGTDSGGKGTRQRVRLELWDRRRARQGDTRKTPKDIYWRPQKSGSNTMQKYMM